MSDSKNLVYAKAAIRYRDNKEQISSTMFVVGASKEAIQENIDKVVALFRSEEVDPIEILSKEEIDKYNFSGLENAIMAVSKGSVPIFCLHIL